MLIFFTSVKESVAKSTDSISRLLRQTLKTTNSHAISTPEIRATNFPWWYSAVGKWKYSCGEMTLKSYGK